MSIDSPDFWRLSLFVSALIIFGGLQLLIPRRKWQMNNRITAGITNMLVVVIGTITIRVVIPVSLVIVAGYIEQHQYGLLSGIDQPWIAIVLGCIALDCVIYWQHRAFHQIPWCWRMHRMHHSDTELGTTTGIRFHPFELIASYAIKIGVMFVLGIDVATIIIFEILLNVSSLWNHSNLAIPLWLDRVVRWVIVTPDMHRVHHSVYREEHNANYGFCLSIWDRIFTSYVDQPRDGHITMRIGLERFRQPEQQRLPALLVQPFR